MILQAKHLGAGGFRPGHRRRLDPGVVQDIDAAARWGNRPALLTGATGFALILDQIKQQLMSALKIE
jgi:hypothetical protein